MAVPAGVRAGRTGALGPRLARLFPSSSDLVAALLREFREGAAETIERGGVMALLKSRRLKAVVLALSLIAAGLVDVGMAEPAQASVCSDFPYSGQAGMINSACRENTIDPGRGHLLSRADLTEGRANSLLNSEGFTDDWIWYSHETTRTFTRGDGQEWSFCDTYNEVDSFYFTTGGFVCDGDLPLGTSGDVMYSFDDNLNSVTLDVFEFDNGFVSRACGNFGTRNPRSPRVSIIGDKFLDKNDNGVWDKASEPARANISFRITRQSSRFNDRTVGQSWVAMTNSAGRFELNMAGKGPGRYKVEEILPNGWRATNSSVRYVDVLPGGGDTQYDAKDFGNLPKKPWVGVDDHVLYEGETIQLDSADASSPAGFSLQYSWAPSDKLDDATALRPFFTGLDDAVDTYTFTATDPFGQAESATATVTTLNVPPATDVGPDLALDENDTFTRSALTYTDPGVLDTHTATVDYGDGSGVQPLTLSSTGPGTGTYSLSHQYKDDDPTATSQDTYVVTVTITDDDGGVDTDTLMVTVNNVVPVVEAGQDVVLDEGDSLVRELSFSDAGVLDTHVVMVDFGEGDGFVPVVFDAGAKSFRLEHVYADDDPTATPQDDYVVTVRVEDDDLGVVDDAFVVRVKNVAPDLEITAPSFDGDLFAGPVTVDLVAPFTDPGVRDTFECRIDWDEGPATLDPAVADTVFDAPFSGTSGNCNASHTYDQAGVYTIRVMVTDDDTLFDVEERMIVVYDPGAGFVTGGGYIDSPAGAYRPDLAVEGKATFGFVSKYVKRGTPQGNTEFQLHAGDLNFHSTEYDWLVVTANGTRAQFKGRGTINGTGDFGFMLTAYDNGEPGSGVDQMRLKIWDTDTDEVVYDNRFGVSDDVDRADPQIITNGNIAIHTKGKK